MGCGQSTVTPLCKVLKSLIDLLTNRIMKGSEDMDLFSSLPQYRLLATVFRTDKPFSFRIDNNKH